MCSDRSRSPSIQAARRTFLSRRAVSPETLRKTCRPPSAAPECLARLPERPSAIALALKENTAEAVRRAVDADPGQALIDFAFSKVPPVLSALECKLEVLAQLLKSGANANATRTDGDMRTALGMVVHRVETTVLPWPPVSLPLKCPPMEFSMDFFAPANFALPCQPELQIAPWGSMGEQTEQWRLERAALLLAYHASDTYDESGHASCADVAEKNGFTKVANLIRYGGCKEVWSLRKGSCRGLQIVQAHDLSEGMASRPSLRAPPPRASLAALPEPLLDTVCSFLVGDEVLGSILTAI